MITLEVLARRTKQVTIPGSQRKVDHLLDSLNAPFKKLDSDAQVFKEKEPIPLVIDSTCLWFDKDHLSVDGANLVLAELFSPVKEALLVQTAGGRSHPYALHVIKQ